MSARTATRQTRSTVRTAVRSTVAALLASAALSTTVGVAGAASGPVFPTTNPFTAESPLGVRHPVSVNGTFDPLVLDCDGEHRVLWYAPGPAADAMWRDVELSGGPAPTWANQPVNINGTYLAKVGDFDGDRCEDVLWYSPAPGGDSIWYFHPDGSHTAASVSVPSGATEVVVGSFNGDAADDVLWSAPGRFTESISTGSPTTGVLRSAASPQMTLDRTPVLAEGRSSVLWVGAGPLSDSLWRDVRAGSTTPGRTEAVSLSTNEVPHQFAGRPLLYSSLTGVGRLVHGITPMFGPLGLPSIVLTSDGNLGTGLGISDSTSRSRIGVLHRPGAGQDYLVDLEADGRWTRVTPPHAAATPDPGRRAFGISEDGRYVLSGAGTSYDMFSILDRTTGARITPPAALGGMAPNGGLDARPDLAVVVGRRAERIAFTSYAGNLVPNDTNGRQDVFVWDRLRGTYLMAPDVGADRTPGVVGMSVDGTVVLIRWISRTNPNVSTGGIKVWDLRTGRFTDAPGGATTRTVGSLAMPASVSADGRLLGLTARGPIPGVPGSVADRAYLFDRATGRFELQPLGVGGAVPNGRSVPVAFSADHTKVLLATTATNLVAGASYGTRNAVVWDRTTGRYTAQPLGFDGAQPDAGMMPVFGSLPVAMSADGTKVLLTSASSNLLPGSVRNPAIGRAATSVYVWDVRTGRYSRQPRSAAGVQTTAEVMATGPSAASADLEQAVVTTGSGQLVAGDTDGTTDGYLWDRSGR